MKDPKEFTDMSDYPQDGYGNIETDNGWDYIEPSQPEIMDGDWEDTDVD